MSSFKYSRLPQRDPDMTKKISFDALDGPSYFSYEVPHGKYKSAFTYSGTFDNKQQEVPDDVPPSLTCRICAGIGAIVCYAIFVLTLPVSLWFTLKRVKNHEQIIIYRLGRLRSTTGSGFVLVLPCIDRWSKVDLRMKAFSVAPQKVITADGAVIEIGAEVYYHVKDAILSVGNVQDLNHSTRIICQTSLQKQLGKQTLADIEGDRTVTARNIQDDVNPMTRTWGVEVDKVDLSTTKLYSPPNPLFNQSNNPLSFLGPVLFPAGTSNAPLEQLQNFFFAGGQTAAGGQRNENVNSGGCPPLEAPKERHQERSAGSAPMDLINAVNGHLGQGIVREFGYIYKFIITGDTTCDTGGLFFLDLKNGEGQAGFGYPLPVEPDVTLTLSTTHLQELLTKQLSPFDAYMGGQLLVSGDLRAAMKLGGLFDTIKK